jgi:hypothetical protein
MLCDRNTYEVAVFLHRDHAKRVEEARVVDAALAFLFRLDEDQIDVCRGKRGTEQIGAIAAELGEIRIV